MRWSNITMSDPQSIFYIVIAKTRSIFIPDSSLADRAAAEFSSSRSRLDYSAATDAVAKAALLRAGISLLIRRNVASACPTT
jgi:hypothetical protein